MAENINGFNGDLKAYVMKKVALSFYSSHRFETIFFFQAAKDLHIH